MEMMEARQRSTTRTAFTDELEREDRFKGLENFFYTERRFLNHLFQLEKEGAEKEMKLLLETVTLVAGDRKLEATHCYFVVLSSNVARRMEREFHIPRKAFAFNSACIMLINERQHEQNIAELAEELLKFYIQALTDKKMPALSHKTVNRVILFIHDRVKSPITVEDIAKEFNISTSHLSRIFREHTGITLVEYINIRKVEDSQYSLRCTEKKIADISGLYHFCNQSYFTRVFKKYTGQTPGMFRSDSTENYFRFRFPRDEN